SIFQTHPGWFIQKYYFYYLTGRATKGEISHLLKFSQFEKSQELFPPNPGHKKQKSGNRPSGPAAAATAAMHRHDCFVYLCTTSF
ncbi:MAG: hypothetical protein KDC61_09485, partial [Saprospiraceae bacterium]|nr:hypothetical protein [Saprospiraceae bacterium]